MAKIVTMGEIMLRLSTPGNERFIQADSFDVNYGGGEANVAGVPAPLRPWGGALCWWPSRCSA